MCHWLSLYVIVLVGFLQQNTQILYNWQINCDLLLHVNQLLSQSYLYCSDRETLTFLFLMISGQSCFCFVCSLRPVLSTAGLRQRQRHDLIMA